MAAKNSSVKRDGEDRTARATARTERTAAASISSEQLPPRSRTPAQRLGNNTKSQAAIREQICEKTGEIQGFTLNAKRSEYVQVIDPETAKSVARSARYQNQSAASKLLFNHQTPRETQWRVTGCQRRSIGEDIKVLYSAAIRKAHYGNLMICGSVWTCPPCAAKISERRKAEITAATNLHVEAGGGLEMITRTFAHHRFDNLAEMVKAQRKALSWMREQRGYKNLMLEIGYVGHIRALEVTYGDANGWHPHDHELVLTADRLTQRLRKKVQSVQFELWRKACIRFGLGMPNRKRGVDVRSAESCAEYIAKVGRESTWGLGSELAKQHTKSGREGSMTPFDLLRRYESGEKRFGPLFIEFANAFFGAHQIGWSRGLKKLFLIVELSDEELAKEQEQDAVVVLGISKWEWKFVLRQSRDVRGLVLDLAEKGGSEAVRRYIDRLTDGECPF